MDASRLRDLLAQLQADGFRDIAGARASLSLPVSRALLNRVVAEAMAGRSSKIRQLDIQPRDGDRFDILVTVSMPFVPVLTVHAVIERQPRLPESPLLGLRWSLLGGLGAMASKFLDVADKLPPGIGMDGEFIVIDLAALAAGSPAAEVLRFAKKVEIHTVEDRVEIQIDLEVPA